MFLSFDHFYGIKQYNFYHFFTNELKDIEAPDMNLRFNLVLFDDIYDEDKTVILRFSYSIREKDDFKCYYLFFQDNKLTKIEKA